LVALLAGAALLGSLTASAQIVEPKPGRIKAANRRALRDAQRADVPYKDSHLDVTPARLKRGNSPQAAPEGSKGLRYKKSTAVKVKPPGLLEGLRRRKKQ